MMVVFGIVCKNGSDRWELEEVYVSYEKAQERAEKLRKNYPNKRYFVTSKNLVW